MKRGKTNIPIVHHHASALLKKNQSPFYAKHDFDNHGNLVAKELSISIPQSQGTEKLPRPEVKTRNSDATIKSQVYDFFKNRGFRTSTNYATGPTGTVNHMAGEMFMSMANLKLVRISYNGTAPALTDLLTGQVQLMFANVAPVAPHVRSGRLRALAVTSAAPSTLFPTLPTMAAAGLNGYESEAVVAVFAPAKIPAAIISRLNQEFVRTLNSADVKEKLLNASVEVVAGGPDRLAAFVKADTLRMVKVIKDTVGVEQK